MSHPPYAYLHSFKPLDVGKLVPQKEGIAWLLAALARCGGGETSPKTEEAVRLYEQFLVADHIESRATCVEDYRHQEWEAMKFFDPAGRAWHHPPLEKRMEVFRDKALALADEAFGGDGVAPDYLIQVSCTGYDSPHATQKLASRKGWNSETRLLHIGHMGCYAALPVAAMAAELLNGSRRENVRASLFLVELCTLHLDPGACDAQQIVMNTLFADGAIRFDISRAVPKVGFALMDYAETIVPNTEKAMTWSLRDSAFLMSLSRTVPVQLTRQIPILVRRLLEPAGLAVKDCLFAVHPGGPKIVELVAGVLELSPEQTQHCRYILRRRGNMSSCTVPHIWNEMLEDGMVRDGTPVISLGFGPGLTLSGNLMRKHADV